MKNLIRLLGCADWSECFWAHTSEDTFSQVEAHVQYNLNGSNTDGSFTVDDSNSFLGPYKILPIAQENKYLGFFSYFITELYVVCTH